MLSEHTQLYHFYQYLCSNQFCDPLRQILSVHNDIQLSEWIEDLIYRYFNEYLKTKMTIQ